MCEDRSLSSGLVVCAAILLGWGWACVTPGRVLGLMDAETDAEGADAVERSSGYLVDRGQATAVRMAAAKTLGRLKATSNQAVDRLAEVLHAEGESPELRAFCAWALGEMRSEPSLIALRAALRTQLDRLTGHHIIEGLAKHYAIFSRSGERQLAVVEALVFFAGSQSEPPPPIYDVINSKTRTLPVNVQVLNRALDNLVRGASAEQKGAVYNAAFELLAGLEQSLAEIVSSPNAWEVRIAEAIRESLRAYSAPQVDAPTRMLILWFLGKLATEAELAKPAADGLVGAEAESKTRPTLSPWAPMRLVATWALSRMMLHAPGPRHASAVDLLANEADAAVLRLLGDLSSSPDEYDQLQKILGHPAGKGGSK